MNPRHRIVGSFLLIASVYGLNLVGPDPRKESAELMCYQVPSQPFAVGVFPSMNECIKAMGSKIGCGCYLQENGIYWPYYAGLVPAAFAVVALLVGPTGWLSAILTLISAIFAAGFLHVAYVTRTQVVHPEETIGALVWLGALTILSIVLFLVFAFGRTWYRRANVANAA